MTEGESKILVEEVLEKFTHPEVWPSAVHEQEALQKAELSNGIVASQDRLHALLPADAHTYVSRCREKNK